MNCFEFRRQLGAVPDSLTPEMAAHRAQCPGCAQAYERVHAFERRLKSAFAISVPEGLADRILLAQTTAERRQHGARRFTVWRAAAVLALGVSVLALYVATSPTAQALPDLAVAHLSHEPYALAAKARVPEARIDAVFAMRGVTLSGDPGEINYINPCPLGRARAIHMVVQRPEGPVTVYFVVDRVDERSSWSRGALKGRSVPLGSGTLVMVADQDASFDAIESQWRKVLDPASA